MVKNRNIVVKRNGDRLLLPTISLKEVDVSPNIPFKAYLMCRIIAYHEDLGILDLKLLSDFVNERSFQIAIEENTEILSSLYIKNVVFIGSTSQHLIFETPLANQDDLERAAEKFQEIIRQRELTELKIEVEKVMEKQWETFSLQLPVKDLKFSDGKVSFDYFISHIGRKSNFEISNSFIKKEHDSIKNYFPKILNSNKFSISIQYEYLHGKILSYTSNSPEISMINESLFELVEDLYIQDNIINNSKDEIYSIDEIAIESSKKIGSEKIQDAQWLLNKLISKEKTKHYYHLRYLSDKHVSDIFNLRMTGKPLSFIFFLTEQKRQYLVWETYSTEEATYVWKLDSQTDSKLKNDFQEHLELVKRLRKNNKMAYLRTKPDNFKKIEHNYYGEDFGFKKWKSLLELFFSNDSV